MSNAKISNVRIKLDDFNFDPKTMQLIHHQFSGKRTDFIRRLDDLLGTWGMAGAANPNMTFGYRLNAVIENGETRERSQYFGAEHVTVDITALVEPADFDDRHFLQLDDPKRLIKLYDLGFNACRAQSPAYAVASYFTLREAVARISEKATWVGVEGNSITLFFKDGDDAYIAQFVLADFHELPAHAQILNNAA